MSQSDAEMSGTWSSGRKIWVAASAATILALVLGVLFLVPTHDTVMRYAVMAEKFAEGNWQEAFHPRFGVGMSFLAGLVVATTGIDGLTACTVVSMLAWGLTIVPLFYFVRCLFGEFTAWIAVALYLVCPIPMLWGFQGLRDTFRFLGFTCALAGIFGRCSKEYPSSGLLPMLSGVLMLCVFRGDTILAGMLLLAFYAVLDRFGRNTWICAASALLFLQAPCFMVWKWTGWWLPAPQYVAFIKKIME